MLVRARLVSKCLMVVIGATWSAGCRAPVPHDGAVTDPIAEMRHGNQRFVENHSRHPHADARWRHENAIHGQHPWATVISCSDSRVPVEMILDAGLGDLFVIRVAGNVVDVHEAGSVEYAVEHLHTPLVAVIGHEQCGAVTAVVRGSIEHGDIPHLVEHIQPVVNKVRHDHPNLTDEALLHAAVRENVIHTMRDLVRRSATVRAAVASGRVKLRGGVYDIDTGKIDWIDADAVQVESGESAGGGPHAGKS